MKTKENVSLKNLNTFGVDATAKYLSEITNLQDIEALYEWKIKNNLPTLLLGGGSNLLFKNNFEGMVSKVCLMGKDIAEEDDEAIYVSAAAGENWHDFVRWTINQGFAGLENLSLIPGTVGAAPIQNIGAYGVELSHTFHSLQAVNLETGEVLEFDKELCQFGYRESFFKSQTLDKLLITSVTFRLPKKPEWHINYAGLREALTGEILTAEVISQAVMSERRRKLPNPTQIGNAGSFFKNPMIKISDFDTLKGKYEELPGFPQKHNDEVKTSAGWLIDQCGWKGHRVGDAGVSDKHALVLVNHGNATGEELWQIVEDIIASVEDKFEITLEPEPRVVTG